MNITGNYNTCQPNFNGKIPKSFLEPIKNTKVSKDLRPLDVAAFREYVDSRPYRMGITPKEIEELKKLDGDEFLMGSYKLIINKMGLPEDLVPPINIVDQPANNGEMAYMPSLNVIFCDKSKMAKQTKVQTFSLLRHECQHYIQNTSVLRHETLGEKAIDALTANYIKVEKETVNNLLNTYTDEQLKELFVGTPETMDATLDYLSKARQYMQSGNKEAYNDLFNKQGENYKSNLIEFQNNLKTKMGVIPKDSPLTPKIEKYFEQLNNVGYYKNNSSEVDLAKYLNTDIEKEALSSQAAADFEFSYNTCPVKRAKEHIAEVYEDDNFVQKMKKDFEENNLNTNFAD